MTQAGHFIQTVALVALAVLACSAGVGQATPLVDTDSPILTATQAWEQRAVFEPTVIYDARRELYRMWYSGGWDSCAMGYADSRDGTHWNKHDGPVLGNGVAGVPMACQNNVTAIDGVLYAYFDTGGGSTSLRVATSRDGIEWHVEPAAAVETTPAAVRLVNSFLWRDGDRWRMLVEAEGPDHIWRTWEADGDSPLRLSISGRANLESTGMFGGPWLAGGLVYFHASASGNLPTDIYAEGPTGRPRLVLEHDATAWWQRDQVADPSIANGLLFFDGVDNGSAAAAIGVVALP